MRKQIRTITYRPGLQYSNTPSFTLSGRWLTENYGWKVGGRVEILELPEGIFIRKIETPPNPNQTRIPFGDNKERREI
jgi:hypothetical protein